MRTEEWIGLDWVWLKEELLSTIEFYVEGAYNMKDGPSKLLSRASSKPYIL